MSSLLELAHEFNNNSPLSVLSATTMDEGVDQEKDNDKNSDDEDEYDDFEETLLALALEATSSPSIDDAILGYYCKEEQRMAKGTAPEV